MMRLARRASLLAAFYVLGRDGLRRVRVRVVGRGCQDERRSRARLSRQG